MIILISIMMEYIIYSMKKKRLFIIVQIIPIIWYLLDKLDNLPELIKFLLLVLCPLINLIDIIQKDRLKFVKKKRRAKKKLPHNASVNATDNSSSNTIANFEEGKEALKKDDSVPQDDEKQSIINNTVNYNYNKKV